MADNTSNYALPYPEPRDGVVVHTDIERLARRIDTIVPADVRAARDTAISDATTKYGDLPSRVAAVETHMLPRADAEQYGIEGPQGKQGERGPRGLPGVNAIENDEAVATYITALDSQTRQALEALTAGSGRTYVQDTSPPEPMPDDVWITPTNGVIHTFTTGQWVAHHTLQPEHNAVIAGDWVFSRGHTGNVDRSRVGVQREFDTARGDLFNSTTRLELSVREQQGTSQNPPGYSMATISLMEDGDNGDQYQGESARMALISNRVLFNRRLEVDMGGSGRANLRSGTEPGHQYAEIGLHNASYPRFTVYGDTNETHGGNRKNVAVLDGARLEVRRSGQLAQSWIKTDALNADQRVHLELADTGHMELYAEYNGQRIGGVRFNADASTVELRATNGITLHDHTTARQNIIFDANRGPVIRSSNGTQYRVSVNNDGTLSTEEVN